MFTGLIQDVGVITALDRKASDVRLTIKIDALELFMLPIGASVACDGVCLTLTQKNDDRFNVDVSAETLSKTTIGQWSLGRSINLEPSLRLGDELGGHLVYGHVDGLAHCTMIEPEGDCYRLRFYVPAELAPYIAKKGSIAINGVSLTVNDVSQNDFGVMIIPHTWQKTTLAKLKINDVVNIEIDMLARYVARLTEFKTVML
jgi:riboflavin synthase